MATMHTMKLNEYFALICVILLLQKEIIDVLYDIFGLSIPKWTDCFAEAILSIGKSFLNVVFIRILTNKVYYNKIYS